MSCPISRPSGWSLPNPGSPSSSAAPRARPFWQGPFSAGTPLWGSGTVEGNPLGLKPIRGACAAAGSGLSTGKETPASKPGIRPVPEAGAQKPSEDDADRTGDNGFQRSRRAGTTDAGSAPVGDGGSRGGGRPTRRGSPKKRQSPEGPCRFGSSQETTMEKGWPLSPKLCLAAYPATSIPRLQPRCSSLFSHSKFRSRVST